MRPHLTLGTMLSVLLTAVAVDAQEPGAAIVDQGPEESLVYRSAEIIWLAGPASFDMGAEFTVLEGDPGEPGVFTMRIRMPDDFVIDPHWHPNVERVTVLSGTFHIGHGEVLDRASTRRLAAGGYFSFPPETRHYAITEGETVVQLTSVGPWEINYVNPEDDPRQKNR